MIYRRALDGGTSWRLDAPPGGFALAHRLAGALAARRKALELYDPRGSAVSVALRRSQGRLIIQTSTIRIDLWPSYAEIIVTALAIETEGIVAWYLRDLPRALWWLLAIDVTASICPRCVVAPAERRGCDRCDRGRRPWASWRDLADELARYGLEQARIEQVADVGGLPLLPGLEDQLVAGGLTVLPYIPKPGRPRSGIEIGHRKNPEALCLYDKPWEMRAKGTDRVALLEAMRAAGWREGELWTRIEARSQLQGLVLVQDGQVVVDGRHPGAALDEAVRDALWRRVLGRIWLSDTRSTMTRPRDRPVSPLWAAIRDAAPESISEGDDRIAMISRAAASQLASVRAKAAVRLGHEAINVGVLDGGKTLDEIADLARRELEVQLAPALAHERVFASRARYQGLLDAVTKQTQDDNA